MTRGPATSPSQRGRELAARVLAATGGSYALSYALAAALSRWLPMARSEAVVLTSTLAPLAMVAIAIWAFACRSVAKLWAIIAVTTIIGLLLGLGVPQ